MDLIYVVNFTLTVKNQRRHRLEKLHIKFYCLAVLIPEVLGKLQISGKFCKVSLFYYFNTVFPFNPFSNILTVKENKLIGIAFHGLLIQGREK